MPLALFDLDHTLLDGDTNVLWLDFLVERGLVAGGLQGRQAEYVKLYVAGKLDIGEYLRFHIGLLAGRPLAEWQPLLAEFVELRIKPRISPQALARVSEHRSSGHRMAIISATHGILSTAIAAVFDLPVICSRVEVRDDYVTGEVDGPICFRETKLSLLADWLTCTNAGETLADESYFYSDSANDLPLLEAVRHPVVVNPDPRLSELAAQRNWPIEVWRCA